MNDALFRPSAFLRRKRCPGSLALESTLPEPPEDESANRYAEEGQMLHRMFADQGIPRHRLLPEQHEALSLAESMEAAAIKEIEDRHQAKPTGLGFMELREQTFSFASTAEGQGPAILFSGTADHVRIYADNHLCIISDLKMGRKEVQAAALNLQLRGYVAAVHQEMPTVQDFYGLILQPRLSSKPFAVHYTADDVAKAGEEILLMWHNCHKPNADRIASSDGCAFCTAKAICPEFQKWIGAVESVRHLPVAQWTDEQMDAFESRRTEAEKFIKDAHEQIKAIKAACPERLPGWTFEPGNQVRVVTDAIKAWSALQGHMSAGDFSDACKVSVGNLERAIWQAHQDNPLLPKLSQKECKKLVTESLKDCVELRQNEPSLVRAKD